MSQESIMEDARSYVWQELGSVEGSHDARHAERVYDLATYIAKRENADLCIVGLASLLHDIADWKYHDGDIMAGPIKAKKWLSGIGVDASVSDPVCRIIAGISFKGAGTKSCMDTLEGKCVQDADRLDALGAIGIARTFSYNGSKGRPLYTPEIGPQMDMTFEQYKKNEGNAINHFYEKLLLLKDLMNTATGRQIAQSRHEFMERFLEQFYKEWSGADYRS